MSKPAKPAKPMQTKNLRLQVVDRGEKASTGCPLRDVYLQTCEDEKGTPGPGWGLQLHLCDQLEPVAARLAAWFRSQGVEVLEIPVSKPPEAAT